MAGEFAGRLKFVKINVDTSPALVDRLTGAPMEAELKSRLTALVTGR